MVGSEIIQYGSGDLRFDLVFKRIKALITASPRAAERAHELPARLPSLGTG